MKLTMSGEVFSHAISLKEALRITKEFGIQNFELWPKNCSSDSADVHPMLYRNRDVATAGMLLQNNAIRLACVAFGGAFFPEVTANANDYVEELIRAIEVAAKLGAPYVNHYCCNIAPQFELDFSILDRYYSRPLRRAEELGVTLVLENEAHDMTHTPENALAIINHFQSSNFRLNLDATNFYQGGNEAFPYAYDLLKDVIGYVHIKNGCIYQPEHNHSEGWKGGKMSGHLAGHYIYYTPPTKGAVNIFGLLDKLKENNYSGFVTLEPHSTFENVMTYYHDAIPMLREAGYF